MNYNNPLPNDMSRVIYLILGVLFSAFSFLYLYCLQGDLLAEVQHVYSGGVTTYSRFLGAIIITIVLMVLQVGVSRLSNVQGRWHAVTYFPSVLVLAVITSLTPETIENFSFGSWLWAFPTLLVLYYLVLRLLRNFPDGSIADGDYSLARYLWPNLLVLLLQLLFCASRAQASDVYLHELKAERLLLEGNYEGASRVGLKSLQTSRRLNSLRLFALAKQGLLGEHLFDFPQPYREESLIDLADTVRRLHRFSSKEIEHELGAWATAGVASLDQYLSLLQSNPATKHNPLLPDYVLCSALLQKDLKTFNHNLRKYYHGVDSDVMQLPKAYREAMLLQAKARGNNALNNFSDTLMLADYNNYSAMRQADEDSTAIANHTRKKYGNTLWWYIDYMK